VFPLERAGAGGWQPGAPVTLTPEQAKWVPRWYMKGTVLSAESATPSWMNIGHGLTGDTTPRREAEAWPGAHGGNSGVGPANSSTANLLSANRSAFGVPSTSYGVAMNDRAAPLSYGINGLGGAQAGPWCRSLGQSSRYWDWDWNAEASAQPPHDDTGTGSQGSTPEMLSARSSASWLRSSSEDEDSRAVADRDSAHLEWLDTDGDDSSPGSSGRLELSGHDSVSTATGSSGATRKEVLSSGCIASPSSVSSGASSSGLSREAIADQVEGTASRHDWSYQAQWDDQGGASSVTASPPSSLHGDDPQEALSWSASSFFAPPKDQGIGLSVEQAYAAVENAMACSILESDRFRSAYGNLKEAMSRAGGIRVEQLSALLAREEESIRNRYGHTRWQSLTMVHDINAGWDAKKRSRRNDQLQWIKDERASLEALASGAAAPAAASLARSRSSGLLSFGRWTFSRSSSRSSGRFHSDRRHR